VPISTPKNTTGCLLLTGKETPYTEEEKTMCEHCCSILALDIQDKGFTFRPFEDREPLVSVRGVVKEFLSGEEIRQILKGVDLDIYPGELVVVLGESGCGKSTLLNIIGGMDQMTSGEVLVEGRDMSNPTEDELTEYRREYVGFIFQAYNLMPNLSAYENVEFIGEIAQNPMDSMEALRLVGLEAKADSMPSALSGGQMQRVSIARALVKGPKMILADEPTAALDYDTSIKVLSVIEDIVKTRNTTVLMVTHNPEIAKMANRVIKLRDGKISSIRVNLHPLGATDLVW
jgi:ABC-type lipoprotein export system ATPase subunit